MKRPTVFRRSHVLWANVLQSRFLISLLSSSVQFEVIRQRTGRVPLHVFCMCWVVPIFGSLMQPNRLVALGAATHSDRTHGVFDCNRLPHELPVRTLTDPSLLFYILHELITFVSLETWGRVVPMCNWHIKRASILSLLCLMYLQAVHHIPNAV